MDYFQSSLIKFSRLFEGINEPLEKITPKILSPITFSIDPEDNDEIIVFGAGLGEAYLSLRSWLHGKHQLILVEEDLSSLKALLQSPIGQDILNDFKVELLFLDWKDPFVFDRLMWQSFGRKRKILSDPRADEEHFSTFQTRVTYDSNRIYWHGKEYQAFGLGFYFNYYQNLREFPTCFDGTLLYGQAKNVPAIIVGAGPSLNKNGHLLKYFKDHALIFAGGSSIIALKNGGIKPDFAGGVDPNISEHHRLELYGDIDFPFLFCSRINHLALKAAGKTRIYIPGTGGFETAAWMNQQIGIPTIPFEEGYSVTNFLTETAFLMGCNPIIYVGTDFAFTDGEAYAKGIEGSLSSLDLIDSLDIFGKPIKTKASWIKESGWIGEYSKNHSGITFFNATNGGIGIPGIKDLPLTELHFKDPIKKFEFKKLNVSLETIQDQIILLKASLMRFDFQNRNEVAYGAILKRFEDYFHQLMAHSHITYLITRDGMNPVYAQHLKHMEEQKIRYLNEVITSQLEMFKAFYGI